VTISNASPGVVTLVGHGLAVGTPLRFATTGALPTGLAAATTYFVKTAPTADTFTVSATPEGAATNTSSAGSGTHTLVQFGGHQLVGHGNLPTGIAAGQDYFVLATGLTANSFQISATEGGTAIDFAGSTDGTISAKTGSDTADGSSDAIGSALRTVQQAIDRAATLDLAGFTVTLQLCDGHHGASLTLKSLVGGTGTIAGNGSMPGNVLIAPTANGPVVTAIAVGSRWAIGGVRLAQPGNGTIVSAQLGSIIDLGAVELGPIGGGVSYHLNALGSGTTVSLTQDYAITGGGPRSHLRADAGGTIVCNNRTVSIYDTPAFGTSTNSFAVADINGTVWAQGNTFQGFATGGRYHNRAGGVQYVAGGGAAYWPGNAAGASDGTGVYV
jgi:hypothetical protein